MVDKALRRRIWGWIMFDWASQPYYTVLLTFLFGPYFVTVATDAFLPDAATEEAAKAQAQSLWSLGQTVTGLTIAASAPLLGAFADTTGRRMPWIIVFSLFFVAGATGLWWLTPDGSFLWGALIAFGIGLIGVEFTTIFTNAMLPDLGPTKEIGRLSGNGYALGYVGGVLSLVVMLVFFVAVPGTTTTIAGLAPLFGLDPTQNEGMRFSGPFVALWFAIFMIPFFVWVREPRRIVPPGRFKAAINGLLTALRSVVGNRSLASYLGSSMLYRDGLAALYGFGGTYAVLVLDWTTVQLLIFGILAAIGAALFAWLGGFADSRFGPKPVIIICILILITSCIVLVATTPDSLFGIPLAAGTSLPNIVFYIVGISNGAAGGVLQSASRTMMVRHAHPDRPTEAFGLYALSGKATAFLGPALIGSATYLTGSVRLGIAPVIFLFLLGLVLLIWVRPQGIRTP
ncbi:MFS transporter [Actibacterium sp. 188UL27-1]|uniref:MFS transporter n=1 Tax=Actibacterium sp. 188UL27-1 TaxID=2786961 RepID=UPI001959F78D|nr:MFS transporter [Actibacterium sp. 188UL27-1]MBM7067113.1 MFS transporter [Actibacterium sp. 188UL27-1]